MEKPFYVFDNRKVWALGTSLLWALFFLLVFLVVHFDIPWNPRGLTVSSPVLFVLIITFFSTFRTVVSSKMVAFFDDYVTVRGAAGAKSIIPYGQLDIIPPLTNRGNHDSSKFGIRRRALGKSAEDWIYVSNPKIRALDNNYLFDVILRKTPRTEVKVDSK